MSLFSKQIDKRIAAYQRELIETHYREVENMYRQIRGWRHDYRNHIQTMKVLAANGGTGSHCGKRYLSEIQRYDAGKNFVVYFPPSGIHPVL